MDSWLEVEAAILGSYEEEWEGEDDDSWLDQPWPETEEPEWCGRSCCQDIIMTVQEVLRLPQGEQPNLKAVRDGAAPGEAVCIGRSC